MIPENESINSKKERKRYEVKLFLWANLWNTE